MVAPGHGTTTVAGPPLHASKCHGKMRPPRGPGTLRTRRAAARPVPGHETSIKAMARFTQTEPEPSTLRWLLSHLNPFWVLRTYRTEFSLGFLVVSFLLVLLWHEIVIPIRSGEQGVYWSRFFGGTLNWTITEGTFLKFPWDEIIVYSVRQQSVRDTTVLLTTDGMTVEIDWYLRYRPIPTQLPTLHQAFGPEYAQHLIVPEVVSSLREIIGDFRADQIYAQDEQGLLARISTDVRKHLAGTPVHLTSMQIMKLSLPDKMASSIVVKLMEEQKHLSYEFRLKAEKAEATRREIEAGGLKRFREISGVDPLKWRGVDATVQLAQSPNTKILLMGTDSKQLPLLLNTESPMVAPASPVGALEIPGGAPAPAPAPEGDDASTAPPPGR